MKVEATITIKAEYEIDTAEYLEFNPDMTMEEMAENYIDYGISRIENALYNHFDGCSSAQIENVTYKCQMTMEDMLK